MIADKMRAARISDHQFTKSISYKFLMKNLQMGNPEKQVDKNFQSGGRMEARSDYQ